MSKKLNSTHGKFITGTIDGKPFSAFIDGVPDECVHDDDGPTLHFNDNGQYFKDADMPNGVTHYTEWLKFNQHNKITGGCTSCSKCGKPFSPNPMDDSYWAI